MTTKLPIQPRARGATAAGLGGLALASVLLLCGAGNLPIENFTPQGAMQADLNAGGHSITNAATINATNVTVSGALTATNFTLPYADVTGNPVSVAGGKTLGVSNSLTLAGTDGSTLNIGAGGTLGSAAFSATNAFLAPSAIGSTVQGYNASTTTLGNSVNGTNTLVQTDANGLLIDSVLRPGAKSIYVSQSKGPDTRTGLSKYSFATPFASLTAAAAAAASGDTIVAEDGTFTDKNIVLVSGVDWLFMPGATIAITGASNNDTIFKDNGTAATVVIGGFGQTFTLTSTASSTSLYGLYITSGSNVVMFGVNFTITDTVATGTATGIYVNGGTITKVFLTGNLSCACGSSSSSYGVSMGSTGGGAVSIYGNIVAAGTGSGYGFYATSNGSLYVSQEITGSLQAILNSSTSTVTCNEINDAGGSSLINNHLTLLGQETELQTATPTTGFTQAFLWGELDTILELTPAGSLASGTVTFPADNGTRVGERLTIATTQTITSLAVIVSGGTIYGYSTGTLSPGSITFEKIAANVWIKL